LIQPPNIGNMTDENKNRDQQSCPGVRGRFIQDKHQSRDYKRGYY